MSIVEKVAAVKKAIFEATYPGNHWPAKGGLTQRDNKLFPGGSCNFTASANCLDYLDVSIVDTVRKRFPYEQVEDVLSAFSETKESHKEFLKYYPKFDPKESTVRPRHFSQMVAWVVNNVVGGNVATFGVYLFDDFVEAVESCVPVVVSGKFTASGHFIAVKGISPDKTFFWVDDSWGDFYSGYRKVRGHNLRYSFDDIKRLCWQGQKRHRCIFFRRAG